MRFLAATVAVALLAGLLSRPAAALREAPLWPGAKFTEYDRALALRRGLQFILGIAHDQRVFAEYGHDLLWCLYAIARTSADPELSRMAEAGAIENARKYRQLHPSLPADADATDIGNLVFGSYTADMIGVRDDRIKEQIRQAAPRFSARDYLNFDPVREPPPSDVPDECSRCGWQNPRGTKVCRHCGAPLKMQSRYDVWYDALIATYTARQYGVVLGAPYDDVIRWVSVMRPYRPRAGNPEFWSMVFAATHVVYTLNHYSEYLLSPRCLPDEFAYLKASLTEAIAINDPESMGEFLDSLRAFGLPQSDPLIRTGFDYLLRTQNADGSWGELRADDNYRYHPTWTAIDGLRAYRWTEVLCPAVAAPRP